MQQSKIFFIIDDDEDDLGLFIEALTEIDESIQCFTALNGEEGLQKLKTGLVPIPDYIFLDLNMPRLNGQQTLAEIKKTETLCEIPIIIYSTSAQKNHIDDVIKLGAAYFLKKPNKFSHLKHTLRELLSFDSKKEVESSHITNIEF